MSIRVTPVARTTIVGAAVIATVFGLAGCTQPDGGSPASSPSVSASATPTASVPPSPSASADASTPITQTCVELVPLQTMYDFDPNFGLQDPFTPAAGSLGASAVDADGVACGWLQQTNGELLEIDVSAPPSADLTEAKSGAGETSDGQTYFAVEGAAGVVQVFEGPYRIVLTSSYFSSAADAATLIDSVTAALP